MIVIEYDRMILFIIDIEFLILRSYWRPYLFFVSLQYQNKLKIEHPEIFATVMISFISLIGFIINASKIGPLKVRV